MEEQKENFEEIKNLKVLAFDKIRFMENLRSSIEQVRQEINQISSEITELEKKETIIREKI
jgi:predicted  nucleic acid-binding Zn-ribbon protein